MGFYRDQVLPRLVELTCGGAQMERWRARTTEGLHGRVVEIGFGSGLNVPVYPEAITEVLAVEPAQVARENLAAARRRRLAERLHERSPPPGACNEVVHGALRVGSVAY